MVYTIETTNTNNASSSTTPSIPLLLPEAITETIAELTFSERSQLNYQTFLTVLIRKHGLVIKGLKFHPDYPFLSLFHIHDLFRLPKEALCFFWYLFESYTIGISFNAVKLQSYIFQCQFGSAPPHSRNLYSLLQWFLPPHQWIKMLSCEKTYVVVLFRRPCSFFPPSMVRMNQSIVYHCPTAVIHKYYAVNPSNCISRFFYSDTWLEVRKTLAKANKTDPNMIPEHIMHDMCAWSDDHPISSKWLEALDDWKRTHLNIKQDTSGETEVTDDEDEEDTCHFDPYEDDPSHPDSHWK